MKKKILYNIYLYLTMFLGLMVTTFLMFYSPDTWIETNIRMAFVIAGFVFTLLITAIICNELADKLNKLK